MHSYDSLYSQPFLSYGVTDSLQKLNQNGQLLERYDEEYRNVLRLIQEKGFDHDRIEGLLNQVWYDDAHDLVVGNFLFGERTRNRIKTVWWLLQGILGELWFEHAARYSKSLEWNQKVQCEHDDEGYRKLFVSSRASKIAHERWPSFLKDVCMHWLKDMRS